MNSTRVTKEHVLEQFELFQGGTGGLDSWLRPETRDEVFDALADLETHPLSRARLKPIADFGSRSTNFSTAFRLLLAKGAQAPVRRTPCALL